MLNLTMNGKIAIGSNLLQSKTANTLEMLFRLSKMQERLLESIHHLGTGSKSWDYKLHAKIYHIYLFGMLILIIKMTTLIGHK